SDRRLKLVASRSLVALGLFDQNFGFFYRSAAPERAILILKQDDFAILIQPCWRACMLEQHQRNKPHQFRLAWKHPQQQVAEPDCLLAQRLTNMRIATARRIPLIEEEVDHRRNRREALDPLDCGWRLETDAS